ncbi:unnamed protein product, partial [Ectocarpus sp. 8 AP-2014]
LGRKKRVHQQQHPRHVKRPRAGVRPTSTNCSASVASTAASVSRQRPPPRDGLRLWGPGEKGRRGRAPCPYDNSVARAGA